MEFPIKFDTVYSGWLIIYIEGPQVIIFKKYCIFSMKTDFALANSAHPDEMLHYTAFHQALHCLPMYLFLVSDPQWANKLNQ